MGMNLVFWGRERGRYEGVTDICEWKNGPKLGNFVQCSLLFFITAQQL